MMRILLILLAVLVAVLAFVMDQPWLNWAAGAMIVVALGAVATHLWQKYSETKQYQGKGGKDREDELRELGIMDVRPQSAESSEATESAEDVKGAASRSESPSSEARKQKARPKEQDEPSSAREAVASRTKTVSSAADETASDEEAVGATDAQDESALGPYLEALRRAIGARTVCLLVQEEMALAYRIEAIRSTTADVRAPETTFETNEPLLTANMSRQAVTVRAVGPDGVPPEALGYYTTETPPVTQLVVAPVPRSGPATYFVCADAGDDASLDIRRIRALIARFAEGLDLLIEAETAPSEPAPTESEAVTPEGKTDSATDGASPRPRSEIIAEEMATVQQRGVSLSLGLVHLNRAERLARTGDEAVATAEEALRTRLQQSAPEGRVERFGELTFGVFYYGGASDVEPWAEQLQEEMAQAEGVLEGGVSIGVAVWGDQDPEALRETATEALHVAYETGDCTIVE